jgi:hypothetical protein
MPRRRLQDLQPNYAAGLVYDTSNFYSGLTYDAPDLAALPENGLLQARFCRITATGGLQKLHGSRRLHSSALADDVMGGFSWRRANGTVQQLAVANGDLHTGTYALPMTWTNQGGTLSTSVYTSFASFRDGSAEVVYLADGGALNKWDGTTLTENIASTPNVVRVWVYNQRLFGITGDSETLYWSALNNGDSLGNVGAGGGSAVVRTFGGQILTAGVAVNTSLLLFHANAISRFTGFAQDDIDIDAGAVGHAAEIGTLAPRSVVVVDIDGRDVAFFLTKQGLYTASEAGVAPVPTPFDRELGHLGSSTSWGTVHAAHNAMNKEIWVLLPSAGLYIYRYDLKAWTGPHGGLFLGTTGTNVMWPSETNLGGKVILSGGFDGFVRHYDYPDTALEDVLSDGSGGSASAMVAELRPWFFGDESLEKLFRHLYLTCQAVNSTAGARQIEWTTSSGDGGVVTFTPSLTYGTIALPWWQRGTYVGIEIVDQGDHPTLYGPLRGEALALGRRR